MSKFFYIPTVGIDVSADFSVVAILAPDGEIRRKPFKIKHNRDGFDYLVDQIKKVEKEFNMKTAIFMESTGVYHLTLFHFLKDKFDTFIFNPLVTNSNKNSGIRKVKNDTSDALSIAKIGKFKNIKFSSAFNVEIFTLKFLCRDYYKLTDTRSTFKKKFSADLRVIFPEYSTIFSDITSKTSLAILKQFNGPQAILDADEEVLVNLITKTSRKGLTKSTLIYQKLIKVSSDALYIGISSIGLLSKLNCSITLIESLNIQIEALLSDIDTFVKPKHLVAYFGIDPSVNQSGKFDSNRNKISKRGTRIGRRALYAVALASIRKKKNGKLNNPILMKYYKENLKGKKKKVALVAVMNKLIKYIFSVLKNQKPYEIRDPKIHEKMYLQNHSKTAA